MRMPLLLACNVRPATLDDAAEMVHISTDYIENKAAFIHESCTLRACIVAEIDNRLVGYLIWDRAFFGRPFVWLLGVRAACRRHGIAATLLQAFAQACPDESLFTSTNTSNMPMHAVLKRCGYVYSGSVENLDAGDPEVFYCKKAPLP